MARRDFFHADKRGTIRAGRRPFAASLLIEIGKGGKGEKEILRSKRQCCEIHETRYALPALPLPAKERRKEEKTAPKGTNARFAAVIRAIQRAHHCHI